MVQGIRHFHSQTQLFLCRVASTTPRMAAVRLFQEMHRASM
jgi:hypothetical protein